MCAWLLVVTRWCSLATYICSHTRTGGSDIFDTLPIQPNLASVRRLAIAVAWQNTLSAWIRGNQWQNSMPEWLSQPPKEDHGLITACGRFPFAHYSVPSTRVASTNCGHSLEHLVALGSKPHCPNTIILWWTDSRWSRIGLRKKEAANLLRTPMRGDE